MERNMRSDEEPKERQSGLRDIACSWALLAILLAGAGGWSIVRALVNAALLLVAG